MKEKVKMSTKYEVWGAVYDSVYILHISYKRVKKNQV